MFGHVIRNIFGHVMKNIFVLRASLLVNYLHLLKNVPEHLVLAETLRKYTSPPECMAATICPVILW